MSSTRHAQPGGEIRAERWASNAAYKVDLLGNLVAKRVELLPSRDDRALAWFIQMISLERAGLMQCVEWIASRIGSEFGSPELRRIAATPDAIPARGDAMELDRTLQCSCHLVRWASSGREAMEIILGSMERGVARMESAVEPRYIGAEVLAWVVEEARKELPLLLVRLCLDPELDWGKCGPKYLPDLIAAIKAYRSAWMAQRLNGEPVTPIGKRLHAAADYARNREALVLVHGMPGTGKSHAAGQWCLMNPGVARLVKVPPNTSEQAFFVAIAESLGVTTSGKSKHIRAAVESVLKTGDLILILDNAHHIFPDCTSYRDAQPRFLQWVLGLPDHKIPALLLASPQFFSVKRSLERRAGHEMELGSRCTVEWLPEALTIQEIEPVCRRMLPELGEKEARYVAVYASAQLPASLSAAARVVGRARYLASLDGRERVVFGDLREALTGDSDSRRTLQKVEQSPAVQRGSRVGKRDAAPLQGSFEPVERPLQPASEPVAKPRFSVGEPLEVKAGIPAFD